MSTNRSPEWRGISRIDYKHTHGWFARIYLKGKRVKSKLFSDNLYESREDALEKAREWRDRKNAELSPKDKPKKIRYATTPPKSNTSGRVGISKTFTRSKVDKDDKSWCYSVTWAPIPGKPRNRAFYVNIYGSDEAAFKAACEFRAAKEREISGVALSAEEREQLLKQSIERIMAYIAKAPEHRHERLRGMHAVIVDEFPDASMWMKSTHPCYQRDERWIMVSNRQRSISIQCDPVVDFRAILPDHPKSMIRDTCVHYRDTTEWNIEALRVLVRKVLGAPSDGVQHHEPADAKQAAEKDKAQSEPAKKPATMKGRARITKAIRLYIEKAPKERRSVLWDLHSLIVDACPIVSLSIQNGIPAYENNGAWMILNNLKKGISLAVSHRDALAEFAEKHPKLISGNRGVMFTKTPDIPIGDFQELAQNVLTSGPVEPENTGTDDAETTATAATPEAENTGTDDAETTATAATPEATVERPKRTFIQYGLPVLTLFHNSIEEYLRSVPEPRQARLRSLHALVTEAFPDLKQSTKFRKPTYEGKTMWMTIGEEEKHISVHIKDAVGIEEFVTKHPKIESAQNWIHFQDNVTIPRKDFQILIQRAFGPAEASMLEIEANIAAIEMRQERVAETPSESPLPEKQKPGCPRKTTTPIVPDAAVEVPAQPEILPPRASDNNVQSQQPWHAVTAYIRACPIVRQQRLLLLQTCILIECPQVQVSMRLSMPTYEFGKRWVAIANQREHVSLYVGKQNSLKDFVAAHPDIESGKTCLNFVDGHEIPMSDIQAVIRKALYSKNIGLTAA